MYTPSSLTFSTTSEIWQSFMSLIKTTDHVQFFCKFIQLIESVTPNLV